MAIPLPDNETAIVTTAGQIVGFFSMLGSLFIIFGYLKFPSIRTFAYRLILYLAISDFFSSFALMLGDQGNKDGCQLQAWLISLFNTSSIWWACSIAFTLHMSFLNSHPEFRAGSIERLEKYYHLVIWGHSLTFSIIPLIAKLYGDTGGVCWIVTNQNADSVILRLLQFYFPLWFGVIYCFWVFYHVRAKLADLNVEGGEIIQRLQYYPLILTVCFFWESINEFDSTVTGNYSALWLEVMDTVFSASAGLCNAIVFGTTAHVMAEFSTLCCGDGGGSQFDGNGGGEGDEYTVNKEGQENDDQRQCDLDMEIKGGATQ